MGSMRRTPYRRQETSSWSRRAALAVVLALTVAACGGSDTSAPPQPVPAPAPVPSEGPTAADFDCSGLTPLKVGYTATGGMFTDLFVAKDLGFFEDWCLDVDLVQLQSSSVLVPAVISGEVDIAVGDGSAAARSVIAGLDVRILAASNGSNILEWWGLEEYTSVRDLVGKTIGITAPGSLSDTSLYRVFQEDPELAGLSRSDFEIVNLAGLGAMVAALESGAVQAITILPPLGVQTQASGHHVIYDTRYMDHLASTTVVNPAFMSGNGDTIVRYLAAVMDALAFVADTSNRTEASVTSGRYANVDSISLNEYAYDFFLPGWILDMEVPIETLEAMFQVVFDVEGSGQLSDIDFDTIVESSFLRQAQELRRIRDEVLG